MIITTVIVILLLPLALLIGALLLNRVPLFEPPGFVTRMKTYLGTNVAELRPDSPFPELRPAVYPVKPARLCEQIPPALAVLGWDWQAPAGDCRYRASVTTPLLRFEDDVSIGVEPVGEASSRLRIRSRSRVGKGDLGANTRHILDLIEAVEGQQ